MFTRRQALLGAAASESKTAALPRQTISLD